MSKLGTKFRYMYDAAPEAAFIAKDGVAKTATFNSSAITLDKVGGYWNVNNELADHVLAIAVNVTALDATTGDETYTLELEAGNAGFAASIKAQKLTITKTGQYVFLVDVPTLKAALGATTLSALRLVGTLAGTTPSITLHAWLAGDVVGA